MSLCLLRNFPLNFNGQMCYKSTIVYLRYILDGKKKGEPLTSQIEKLWSFYIVSIHMNPSIAIVMSVMIILVSLQRYFYLHYK